MFKDKVIRGYSEREVELNVNKFLSERYENHGEEWEAGLIINRPARLLNYKPWVCVLKRMDDDE